VSRHNALLDGGLPEGEVSVLLERCRGMIVIELVVLKDGICRVVRQSGCDPMVEWHRDTHYENTFRTLHDTLRKFVTAFELETSRRRPVDPGKLLNFYGYLLSVALGRGKFSEDKGIIVVSSDAGVMDVPWAFPLSLTDNPSVVVYQLPSLVGLRSNSALSERAARPSALILADQEPVLVLRGGLVDRLCGRFRRAGWNVDVWRGTWENGWGGLAPDVILILGHGAIDEDSEQQVGMSVGGEFLTPSSMSTNEFAIGGRTVSLGGLRLIVLGGCVAGRTSGDAGAYVLPMARALIRRGTTVVAPLSRFVIDPRGERGGRTVFEVMLETLVADGVASGFCDVGRSVAIARVEAAKHGSTNVVMTFTVAWRCIATLSASCSCTSATITDRHRAQPQVLPRAVFRQGPGPLLPSGPGDHQQLGRPREPSATSVPKAGTFGSAARTPTSS